MPRLINISRKGAKLAKYREMSILLKRNGSRYFHEDMNGVLINSFGLLFRILPDGILNAAEIPAPRIVIHREHRPLPPPSGEESE